MYRFEFGFGVDPVEGSSRKETGRKKINERRGQRPFTGRLSGGGTSKNIVLPNKKKKKKMNNYDHDTLARGWITLLA